MNLKKAKALRQLFRAQDINVRDAVHETVAVRSRKYSITITETGKESKVMKDHALQVRLQVGCPRQQYQKAKQTYVSNSRSS